MMARRLPGVTVLVCEKRAIAVKSIEQSVDVIILDDAFQHRAVQRDMDIVLVSRQQPWRFNFVLPAGNLREPRYRLRRADAVVETHSHAEKSRSYAFDGPVCVAQFKTDALLDLSFTKKPANMLEGQRVFAFAGIGQPQTFIKTLATQGAVVAEQRFFRDHASYGVEQIREILKQAKASDCDYLLCTEKDLVKIATQPEIHALVKHVKLYALAGEMEFLRCRELIKKVQTILDIKL